jgi:hypothetical protein
VNKSKIPNFIGAYQSEGFGEILINPSFLMAKEFKFKRPKEAKETKENIVIKSNLAKFLQQREDDKQIKLDIATKVDNFINKNKSLYKNIKPSQWGAIRAICNKGENNFKQEIKDYISKGVKVWEQNQIDTLLNFSDDLDTIKLLSIQMPKGVKND